MAVWTRPTGRGARIQVGATVEAMAGNKTTLTDVDPFAFVAAVEPAARRADAETLLGFMSRVTGWEPRMWGPSIIGYGRYRYTYGDGRTGESLATGFSPRKANTVLYIVAGYDDLTKELAALGKHRIGKSCLYVNRLSDINLAVLEQIIRSGLETLRARYEVTSA